MFFNELPHTKKYLSNSPFFAPHTGASNIVIEQPGYHDENYIVLRDDKGNSLLNGANIITAFPNVSFYAGVAYDYNGSKSFVERVNTTYTRKLKRDMIVEVFQENFKINISNYILKLSDT